MDTAQARIRTRNCVLEEDATLRLGMGREIEITLRAYGTFYKAFRGQFEKGGLQLTPSEPAHYSIDSVTISTGKGSLETEIYNGLNEDALGEIANAAMEANGE